MALAEDILERPTGFVYVTESPKVVAGAFVKMSPLRVTEAKKSAVKTTGYSSAVHRSFLLGLAFVTLSGCVSLFGVISESDAFSLAGALILPLGLFSLMNWVALANGERSKKLD